MSVKKSVLEQKTSIQLEEYIKPESRFVPQAVKFAFEILKSRGRDFSEDETEIINSLINKKEEKVKIVIHENNIKSSNLMFLSAFLGLLNFLLSGDAMIKAGIRSAIFSLIFIIFLSVLIRKGYNTLKYILLGLLLLGSIFSIPYMIYDLNNFPINGIISVCQYIVQIASVILLFLIPKQFSVNKAN